MLKSKPIQINWFRLNRSLHRDVGYFCIGFILIYAISGIAVNHKNDWNPNYAVHTTKITARDIDWNINDHQVLIKKVLTLANTQLDVKASYWQSPNQFKVFLHDDANISLNLNTNTLTVEQIRPRPIFQALNRLHLNETHQSWIIVSDIFAALLLFLAMSSLFMIRGKYGPFGKRGLFILAGFAIPAGFIFL